MISEPEADQGERHGRDENVDREEGDQEVPGEIILENGQPALTLYRTTGVREFVTIFDLCTYLDTLSFCSVLRR